MECKIKLGVEPKYLIIPSFGLIGIFFFISGLNILRSTENPRFYEDYTVLLSGCIFLIFSLITLFLLIRRYYKLRQIVSDGKYLWGEVNEIVEKNFIKINYRHIHIYHLAIQYQDAEGNVHTFRSNAGFYPPHESVIGLRVKVYYEDERYKYYYVDLDNGIR